MPPIDPRAGTGMDRFTGQQMMSDGTKAAMEASSKGKGPPEPRPPRKRRIELLASLAVIVVFVILAGVWFSGALVPTYDITEARQHTIVTVHDGNGTHVETYIVSLPYLAQKVKTAGDLELDVAFYANNGTQSINDFSSGTSGFAYMGTLQTLPFEIRNSTESTLTLVFQTPHSSWSGSFDFTVYMDLYK
jgi:hypothetical protein